jgi:hypothetical protein
VDKRLQNIDLGFKILGYIDLFYPLPEYRYPRHKMPFKKVTLSTLKGYGVFGTLLLEGKKMHEFQLYS